MKKTTRFLLELILFFAIFAVNFSFASEITVNSETEFLTALSNESVTLINLGTDINIQADGSGDNALVIERPLTIKGGSLASRRGGIVLGADVTFENITLSFENLVRNGIFANGNTLTLNGVKNGNSGVTSIYLFCGGVTNYTGTNVLPENNLAGKIIIKGDNTLGSVFAGSFSDTQAENNFIGSADIIIENNASGTIGNIYAHGAYESRGEGSGDAIYPVPEKYKVSGNVNIKFNKRITVDINGDTGTDVDAKFIYSGDENVFMPVLANVSEIVVSSGNLFPKVGSGLSGNNPSLSITSGARLNI